MRGQKDEFDSTDFFPLVFVVVHTVHFVPSMEPSFYGMPMPEEKDEALRSLLIFPRRSALYFPEGIAATKSTYPSPVPRRYPCSSHRVLN